MNEPLTTERGSVTVHPGGVDQSSRFRLPNLDGRYYWLDGVLYVNTDYRLATELTADGPQLPAINQAAFDRLQELTEENNRLRSECRECADALSAELCAGGLSRCPRGTGSADGRG